MASITLESHELNDQEQACILAVWECNSVGVGPDFKGRMPELRVVAERLSARGLMYLCNDGGYCLTKLGDWIGETLFDSRGCEFGDNL